MNKKTCVIYGPVSTFSGYGARARDIAKSIIELKQDEWDIKIIPCRWGNTPMDFMDQNPDWKFLEDHYITQLDFQPDYMFWITIPNEAQKWGKWNCLITAGIETTLAPGEWVEGCERMDLVLGSSKHTIDVLKNSKFEKKDSRTQQIAGHIEWTGDGEVLFEGVDTEIYKPTKDEFNLPNITESFCFLMVGHWIGNGPIGEDRKNISLLVKGFYETFKNKSNPPALILKTSKGSSSYSDRDQIIKHIQSIKTTVKASKLPNIYLVHGDISDEDMNKLYNHPKVKAMINLTKGEGFGRPLLEFSTSNKPIITTGWSGHIDFLNPEFTTLLKGNLTKVHPAIANDMLLPDAEWFSVDYGQVGFYLKDMFSNYKNYIDKGKRQGYHSRTNYSLEKMKETLNDIFNRKLPIFPDKVTLKLPSLKRIDLPKLNKIEPQNK